KLGLLAEAEQSHRGYIAEVPDSSRAHSDLADVLLALGRYNEALAQAQRAVELDPSGFLPHFTAGLAAAMMMRFEEARDWFERAQRADPAGLERFLSLRSVSGALDRDLDPRAIYLIHEFDRLE